MASGSCAASQPNNALAGATGLGMPDNGLLELEEADLVSQAIGQGRQFAAGGGHLR